MKMRSSLFGLTLALALATPAWAEPDHDHEDHAEHEDRHEEIVSLSSAELAEFGIVVTEASPGTIELQVSLPGEVRPNEDRLAHIVPRYSGIVTEVRAGIGDLVEKGQILAVVESDESLAPFDVKTLIPGTIIAKHMALGEAVSRLEATFIIADLSTVWIDLTVYQRDIAGVRVGQTAHIQAGHGLVEDSGTISYVTPVVDEATRTATARVVLSNTDGRWRPGMFVTAEVSIARADVAVAVPRTAIHSFEDNTVVFIETESGFSPQPVELGLMNKTQVEVLSGLQPGTHYVSQGGFTIKAELGKGAFGDGHAH